MNIKRFMVVAFALGCEPSMPDGTVRVVHSEALKEPRAARILKEEGYTNVSLLGSPLFGCGDDDSFINSNKFSATNAAGKRVTGVVCCGWLKGCTIRRD